MLRNLCNKCCKAFESFYNSGILRMNQCSKYFGITNPLMHKYYYIYFKKILSKYNLLYSKKNLAMYKFSLPLREPVFWKKYIPYFEQISENIFFLNNGITKIYDLIYLSFVSWIVCHLPTLTYYIFQLIIFNLRPPVPVKSDSLFSWKFQMYCHNVWVSRKSPSLARVNVSS